MALTKFCNAQYCKHLIPITDKYCADHDHLVLEQEAKRQATYDKAIRYERDAQFTDFYHSSEWLAKRAFVIDMYKGIDVYAYYKSKKIVNATTVHHIEPLRDGWSKRLLDVNLLPISAQSHGEIEALYKRDKIGTQARLKQMIADWNREFAPRGL